MDHPRLVDILRDLLAIQAPAGDPGPVIRYIDSHYRDRLPLRSDSAGNLSLGDFENARVLLNAHTDAVHATRGFTEGAGLLCCKERLPGVCLGGDDRCGLAIALAILEQMPDAPIMALFTTKEESGQHGIQNLGNPLPQTLQAALSLDRKFNNQFDIIETYQAHTMASPSFIQTIRHAAESLDLPVGIGRGAMSDAYYLSTLWKIPQVVNLTVGYVRAHSEHECVILERFHQAGDWIERVVRTLIQPDVRG